MMRSEREEMMQEYERAGSPSAAVPLPLNAETDWLRDMRDRYTEMVETIPLERRREYTAAIWKNIESLACFADAEVILLSVAIDNDPVSIDWVRRMIQKGKRIVVPFIREREGTIGIRDFACTPDTIDDGTTGSGAGKPSVVYRIDIQMVICRGTAFDSFGRRLDNDNDINEKLLYELSGRIPFVAFAFQCQIMDEVIPMVYGGIVMDQIVTENGPLLASSMPELV